MINCAIILVQYFKQSVNFRKYVLIYIIYDTLNNPSKYQKRIILYYTWHILISPGLQHKF